LLHATASEVAGGDADADGAAVGLRRLCCAPARKDDPRLAADAGGGWAGDPPEVAEAAEEGLRHGHPPTSLMNGTVAAARSAASASVRLGKATAGWFLQVGR
jgi:hypothetical protein